MPILNDSQRQELVDKITQANTSLTTYTSLTFQTNLRQAVVDAQAVDDGIKAIYDYVNDNIVGQYYVELLNMDGRRVDLDLNMQYTDARLVVPPATFEDEVMTLGELSDDYLDVISEGIQARIISPFFTPTDVRRLFPEQNETRVTEITQFIGTPIIRDTISPDTWPTSIPIVNAESFFLVYEDAIANATGGSLPANTTSFSFTSNGADIGNQSSIIQTFTLTATAPTMDGTNSVTMSAGQQFTSTGGNRVIVLVGGTATATNSGMGMGSNSPASIVCGNLNSTQRVQALAGQTDNLNAELTAFDANLNTAKLASARAEIVARLAEVVAGGSSDATARARRTAEIALRIVALSTNITGTPTIIDPFFDRRYDSATQRANFADGSLGILRGKLSSLATFQVMIDADTTTVTDGTEITRLRQLILDLQSQIDFSDAQP